MSSYASQPSHRKKETRRALNLHQELSPTSKRIALAGLLGTLIVGVFAVPHARTVDRNSGARRAGRIEALAELQVSEINNKLYTPDGQIAGKVPVDGGYVDGVVTVKTPGETKRYDRPIVLAYTNGRSLNGAWVTTPPTFNAEGHITMGMDQLPADGQGMTVELTKSTTGEDVVAQQPVVYIEEIDGHDQLMVGEADGAAAATAVPIAYTGAK